MVLDEYSHDGRVEPECVLPVQFDALGGHRPARVPERRLLFAVLIDAIRVFRAHLGRANRRSCRLVRETEEWFASDDVSSPFSFVAICERIDFSPGYLRRGLLRLRARHLAARAPSACGTRFPSADEPDDRDSPTKE